jgi:hypothetical protein
MKKKIIALVAPFAFLMLVAAIGPAMAIQPKLTFNNTNFSYPDPNQLGTRFTKDNVLHVRNAGDVGEVLFSPWGVITYKNTNSYNLYLTSFTGSGVGHGSYACEAVGLSYDGSGTMEFTGIQTYTYHGESFIAKTNTGGTYEVIDGEEFIGIGFAGQWCGQGTMNDRGFHMRVTFAGVSIFNRDSNHGLGGASLLTGTFTYWFTG